MSPSQTDALLRLEGIQVVRDRRTVLQVDHLEVARGELLAVIGPNGAGKSTLACVLGLLERPTRGSLWLDGTPVPWRGNLLAQRRRIAMVLQEPLLFDTSVRENVETGLRFRGLDRGERERRVRSWLERLGIGHLAHRSARTLSGGEAQRVSLARALVLEPELLVLDEPFRALDPPTREELLEDVLPFMRGSVSSVLITHDHAEAVDLCDRLAVVIDGRIAQVDAPRAVLQQPASEAVARFVRAERRRLELQSLEAREVPSTS